MDDEKLNEAEKHIINMIHMIDEQARKAKEPYYEQLMNIRALRPIQFKLLDEAMIERIKNENL